MKIRTRMMLAIPPLFMVLATASGLLAYFRARSEILWGLRGQARSLSITAAAFLSMDGEPGSPDTRRALARIAAFGPVRGLYFRNHAGPCWRTLAKRNDACLQNSALPALAGAPPRTQTMRVDGAQVGPIVRTPQGVFLTAYAPVAAFRDDRNPGPVTRSGMVAVVIDASPLSILSARVRRQYAWAAVWMVLAGTLITVCLATFLSRRVNRLGRAVRQVALGASDALQVRGVREISDLGNTLSTLGTVRADTLWRERRALLPERDMDSERARAMAYRKPDRKDVDTDIAGMHLVCRHLGQGHPGDFCGFVKRPQGGAAWTGRLTGGTTLANAIEAAALDRVLRYRLAHEAPESVIDALCRRFPVQRIGIATWRSPDLPGIRLYESTASTQHRAPLHVRACTLEHGMHVLHAADDADMVARWLELCRGTRDPRKVGDMARVLEPVLSGPLLVLSLQQADPEA